MFFSVAGKALSVPFSQQDTREIPSQLDKIGWFPSQLIKFISQPGIKLINIYKNERNNNDDDDDDNNNNTY